MHPAELPPLHLQATRGRPLAIELEAMPGAGSVWQLPPAPPGCTLVEAAATPAGAGTGGPALQRFVLTAADAGQLTLHFERRRPWETQVHARQTVQVDVR